MGILLESEGWARYVDEDLASIYMSLIRVLKIYEEIKGDPEPYKQFFIGVIGGGSIGHSRRVMRTLKHLLGVRVSGAGDALRLMASGVPFEKASQGVSIEFISGTSFRGLATVSIYALESVFRGVSRDPGVFLKRVGESVARDLSALRSDPLYIFKILGGVAASATRAMPLRNPHSLAIKALEAIPLGVFKKLFGDPHDISRASGGLLDLHISLPLGEEDLSIISHKPGSPGDKVSGVIENLYSIHSMIRKTCRPYIQGDDEKLLHIKVMAPEAGRVARSLGVDMDVEKILIRSSTKTTNPGPDIALIKGIAIIDRDLCRAGLREGIAIDCRKFLEYMGLKIALGTGRIETIGRSERKVKIRWSVSIESEA
jgi:hypothetical protein